MIKLLTLLLACCMATPVFSMQRTISLVIGNVKDQQFDKTQGYSAAIENGLTINPTMLKAKNSKVTISTSVPSDYSQLKNCYTSILKLADSRRTKDAKAKAITGIAIPPLGCVGSEDKEINETHQQQSAEIALTSVLEYFTTHPESTITDVHFVMHPKNAHEEKANYSFYNQELQKQTSLLQLVSLSNFIQSSHTSGTTPKAVSYKFITPSIPSAKDDTPPVDSKPVSPVQTALATLQSNLTTLQTNFQNLSAQLDSLKSTIDN